MTYARVQYAAFMTTWHRTHTITSLTIAFDLTKNRGQQLNFMRILRLIVTKHL